MTCYQLWYRDPNRPRTRTRRPLIRVDATPARIHIGRLLEAGLSLAEIGRRADIPPRRVQDVWTDAQRTASGIKATEAEAILALDVPTNMVASVGTIRRIQALVTLGYPLEWIAEQLHAVPAEVVTELVMTKWATARIPLVDRDHAAAVTALYRRLYLTPGPSDDARMMARQLGWASSLAWDSHNAIDDPDAKPKGVPGRRRSLRLLPRGHELRDIVADHRSLGHSDEYIAASLEVKLDSLHTAMRRNGIQPRKPDDLPVLDDGRDELDTEVAC